MWKDPSLISLLPLLFVSLNQVQPTTQCSFCIFLVKTLEGLLPKERTEVSEGTHVHTNKQYLFALHTHTDIHVSRQLNASRQHCRLCGRHDARSPSSPFLLQGAVIKLLEEICHILPSSYRDQCEAVVGKFSKTVLDAILGYATPQAICALIHLCKGQEAPLVGQSAAPSVMCAGPNSILFHTFGHILQKLERAKGRIYLLSK